MPTFCLLEFMDQQESMTFRLCALGCLFEVISSLRNKATMAYFWYCSQSKPCKLKVMAPGSHNRSIAMNNLSAIKRLMNTRWPKFHSKSNLQWSRSASGNAGLCCTVWLYSSLGSEHMFSLGTMNAIMPTMPMSIAWDAFFGSEKQWDRKLLVLEKQNHLVI